MAVTLSTSSRPPVTFEAAEKDPCFGKEKQAKSRDRTNFPHVRDVGGGTRGDATVFHAAVLIDVVLFRSTEQAKNNQQFVFCRQPPAAAVSAISPTAKTPGRHMVAGLVSRRVRRGEGGGEGGGTAEVRYCCC